MLRKTYLFSLVSGIVLSFATTVMYADPMAKNPTLEAALHTCASTVTKDANGRPDRAAMHACMKSKGFGRPHPHSMNLDRPAATLSNDGQSATAPANPNK